MFKAKRSIVFDSRDHESSMATLILGHSIVEFDGKVLEGTFEIYIRPDFINNKPDTTVITVVFTNGRPLEGSMLCGVGTFFYSKDITAYNYNIDEIFKKIQSSGFTFTVFYCKDTALIGHIIYELSESEFFDATYKSETVGKVTVKEYKFSSIQAAFPILYDLGGAYTLKDTVPPFIKGYCQLDFKRRNDESAMYGENKVVVTLEKLDSSDNSFPLSQSYYKRLIYSAAAPELFNLTEYWTKLGRRDQYADYFESIPCSHELNALILSNLNKEPIFTSADLDTFCFDSKFLVKLFESGIDSVLIRKGWDKYIEL